MSMYGNYLKISSEKLKELLQSQPEVVEDFLSGVRLRLRDQSFGLNHFFYDLHFYLGRLLALDSLWQEWGVSITDGEVGKKIENVSLGMGTVRFVAPNEVQAIANVLTAVSKAEVGFMKLYRKEYPNRQEEHYDWVLSTY